MTKHKISFIFLLLFSMMAINSCGGSASTENPTPVQESTVENQDEKLNDSNNISKPLFSI